MTQKVVLVTGASAGMGREAALLLAEQGHTVYAAARRLDRMEDLKAKGIRPLKMDITKDDDNRRVVDQIISEQGRIDALINNAGFGLYGPIEEVDMDRARYQFDVNIFGLASLTQMIIPHMRTRRSGRIINVSSVGGKIYTPLGAWYHATKHALEGWSDCLRMELRPFNIDVVIIEPGLIRTEFADVATSGLSPDSLAGSPYKPTLDAYLQMLKSPGMDRRATHPRVLAAVMAKAVNARRPRTRYVKGFMGGTVLFLRRLLSDRAYDRMLTGFIR